MATETITLMPQLCEKFVCNNCDYKTNKKSSYNTHLLSYKHLFSLKINPLTKLSYKTHICANCDKHFKDRYRLWRHNKKCVQKTTTDEFIIDKELITSTLKQNTDLIKIIQETLKENIECKDQINEFLKLGNNIYK